MHTRHNTKLSSLRSIGHTIINFAMLTIRDILDSLDEYIEEGNAVCIDGLWRTQDAQYRNRLTKTELVKYFIKEYYPEYNN
jgi:hypothetical protein